MPRVAKLGEAGDNRSTIASASRCKRHSPLAGPAIVREKRRKNMSQTGDGIVREVDDECRDEPVDDEAD